VPSGVAEDFLWDELSNQTDEDRRAWSSAESYAKILIIEGGRA
jgi:hypothetical protein